jgi:glucose-1-phosphate thymidylyltransferase
MRKSGPDFALSNEQIEAAGTGVKAMVPVGRPFIEYQLSRLADAGYDDICLVTGPEHQAVRDYCNGLPLRRIRVFHAIQLQPRGTADAVAASAEFAGSDEFLVINSDNFYPLAALRAARQLDGPGLVAFSARTLVELGGIPAKRVSTFPRVTLDGQGYLVHLTMSAEDGIEGYVSMNCWRFGPTIFEACRSIPPSARNELELPDAVEYSMTRLGQRYRVTSSNDPVLDLSSQADIGRVTRQLADVAVRF